MIASSRRPLIAVLVLVLPACGGPNAVARTDTALSEQTQQAAAPKPASDVAAAELRVDTATVSVPLSLPAQLYVEHDAVVAARSSGTVDSVLVDVGMPVSGGQLLASLESVDQSIALAQARESADADRRLVERMRALAATGGATRADSEQAELQYAQADLTLRKAQRDLELTRITAPFAGVVSVRVARPHRLVAPGDTLFRVTATAPLLAAVRVPEASAETLGPGSPAQVVGIQGSAVRGRVVRAAPAIDAASGTREMIVEVASDARLRPGASVTVRLGGQQRRVISIPRDVVTDGYALVSEHNSTALRPVVLGADLGNGRVEVLSGLSAGDRLVRPVR